MTPTWDAMIEARNRQSNHLPLSLSPFLSHTSSLYGIVCATRPSFRARAARYPQSRYEISSSLSQTGSEGIFLVGGRAPTSKGLLLPSSKRADRIMTNSRWCSRLGFQVLARAPEQWKAWAKMGTNKKKRKRRKQTRNERGEGRERTFLLYQEKLPSFPAVGSPHPLSLSFTIRTTSLVPEIMTMIAADP